MTERMGWWLMMKWQMVLAGLVIMIARLVAAEAPVLAAAASAGLLAQAPKQVHLADLGKTEKGSLWQAETALLAPGRYRLHAPLALAPLGTLVAGTLKVRLQAGEHNRELSAVSFPADDQFSDLTLEWTQERAAKVPLAITWEALENQKTKGLLGRRQLEIQAATGGDSGPKGPDLDLPDTLGLTLEDDRGQKTLAQARQNKFRLLAGAVHVERLSPVVLQVRGDRITAKPGEPLGFTVRARHLGPAPLAAELQVELLAGLAPPRLLHQETLTLAPGAAWERQFADLVPTAELYWGAELRATLSAPGEPVAQATEVFAVRRNFWETAITAAHPAHLAAFDDPARAQAAAMQLREQGFTGFEAFFWGPCDMLDFTPDQELFFSGQTGYPGTRKGTRNLLTACHEQGLFGTVYANLWGGSGPPAMEVMRRHPEWFGNANYNTSVLSDWDLFGPAAMGMYQGQIRMPGITHWSYSQISLTPPPELFAWHARELIESAKLFGWDGVRYDSFYSRYWTIKAMRQIRAQVAAVLPDYNYGYNSFAHNDWRSLGLETLVGGGGMIMAEGIRLERSQNLRQFSQEVRSWRELIWAYGGHGPGMIFRDGTDEEEMTPVGIEHQAAIILAGGGHLYYNPVRSERANYPRHALRYSELFYDHTMRAPAALGELVTLEPAAKLLDWEGFARLRLGPGEQRRLVLHLLPEPANLNPFKDKTLKAPPVLRHQRLRWRLPPGATASGAWLVAADPAPRHEAITWTTEGQELLLSLPPVHFWATVVLEWQGGAAPALRPSPKAATDSYIQDWLLAGPFPNDLEMSGVKAVYGPETNAAPSAEYPVGEGQPIRWRPSQAAGAPKFAGRAVDFREVLGLEDNRPGCVYARTVLHSERGGPVRLLGKADDTLQIWLNGEALTFTGGQGEFQDRDEGEAKAILKAGPNVLLVKVCEKWLYWLLALRVADETGQPIAGLRVEASHP